MDQFLEELSYIRIGMTMAAKKMEAAVNKFERAVTVADLLSLEKRLLEHSASLEQKLEFLCGVPDGLEDIG